MKREEAFNEMKRGKKVTHLLFSDIEYLFMEEGTIKSEEGYDFTIGWLLRDGGNWLRGWSFFKTK